MRKVIFAALMCAVAAVGQAELSVTVNSVDFNERNRRFTVKYTLAGANKGIVTLDVLADGVSLGGEQLKSVMGEINQKLAAGSHEFWWTVDADWSGSAEDLKFKLTAHPLKEPPLFLSVELYGGHLMRYYEREDLLPCAVTNQHFKNEAILFKKVAAKGITYVMGDSDLQKTDKRLTPHKVTFTNDYYFGVFPVTVGQYRNVAVWKDDEGNYSTFLSLGTNTVTREPYRGYAFNRDDYSRARALGGPGMGYYFRGATDTTIWPRDGHTVKPDLLFQQFRNFMPGYEVDAPTSAQWEYVCRAGTGTKYHNGNNTNANDIAWYAGNNAEDPNWVEGWPHAVGLKKPNAWGFYDMQGNVRESCIDWQLAENKAPDEEVDPPGRYIETPAGGVRICKGTSFLETSVRPSGGYWYQTTAGTGVQSIEVGVRLCFNAEGVEE